ncbi:MAG: hypothetical protein AAGA69_01195 [Pseudomonadota bacterium]
MRDRPVLRTLAALFLLAGGGQVIGALSVTGADAGRLFADGSAISSSAVRSDGLVVRDERSERPQDSLSDPHALTAERIELRLAAAEMKQERVRIEAATAKLAQEKSEERMRLAALYARMPAEKTASILSSLSPEEAAEFISAMSGDAGAEVLSRMTDETAVAVTKVLVAQGF